MSVGQACSMPLPSTSCELTWLAASTDTALCNPNGVRSSEYDCGGYHVLRQIGVDSGATFYYDGTSGALVAIVTNSIAGAKCVGGPATGFSPPSCSAATNPPPPPQCIVDGGVEDGAAG